MSGVPARKAGQYTNLFPPFFRHQKGRDRVGLMDLAERPKVALGQAGPQFVSGVGLIHKEDPIAIQTPQRAVTWKE